MRQRNKIAIPSFILGILSVLPFFVKFPGSFLFVLFPLDFVGLILGMISIRHWEYRIYAMIGSMLCGTSVILKLFVLFPFWKYGGPVL